MIDPTPGDSPLADPLTDAEREVRIEQLLVSGLDEYFAGRMDHAVNVWTRVLFLDRANDRARAYIDRARRAQAERQRESEALVHQGLQAFDDGDVDRARRLLTSAVERGAPHEQALPVLHRIGLLDVTAPGTPAPPVRGRWRRADGPRSSDDGVRLGPWLLAMGIAVLAGVAVFVAEDTPPSSLAATAIEGPPPPLPVPAASEAHLSRARQLFDAGKLPDALQALDRISQGDAAFGDAQTLRGRIQRELLAAAGPGGKEPAQP
jgi:tetratricopeptide (TPR) repeat protein